MKLNTLIIDDFLDDPDQIRNLVIDSKVPFEKTGEVPHPGKRTVPSSDPDYKNMIVAKLHEVLPFKIKMRPNFSFSYQLCLSHDETWVHLDPSDWTGVLYLTPNAPIESGTLLFKEDVKLVKKLRDYDGPFRAEGEVRAEVMSVLGNVYNRLVLFRGGEIPHRSNLAGVGDCLENGRLTQVFFFDEV